MQYHAVAPAELELMRQATKPATDKVAADYDPAKVQLFNAELERVRKN